MTSTLSTAIVVLCFALFGCGDTGSTLPAETPRASAIVEAAQQRFTTTPIVGADGIHRRSITPFAGVDELRDRREEPLVVLAAPDASLFRIADRGRTLAVQAQLLGTLPVRAERGHGLFVYRGGHASGADVIRRVGYNVLEDYLVFERAPARPRIDYEIELSSVAGLRLVANQLEFLDASGDPRLRVPPPWLIDADGKQQPAELAVEGCAYDTNAGAPWLHAVVSPGASRCTLHVSWSAEVRYPALLDPAWTPTTGLTYSVYQAASMVLNDGTPMVLGGYYMATGNAIANSQLYHVAGGGSWTFGPTMAFARAEFAAVQMPGSHNMVCTGGYGSSFANTTSEIIYYTGGSWSSGNWLNMPHARAQHIAVYVPSTGEVMACGGFSSSTGGTPLCDLFNETAVTWRSGGHMNYVRYQNTGTVINGNTLVVAGGKGKVWNIRGSDVALNTTETLALNQITTTFFPAFVQPGTLIAPRRMHTAVVFNNNTNVLIAGGYDDGAHAPVGTAQIFNGTSWSSAVALKGAARLLSASTVLANGAVMIAGGTNTISSPATGLADVDIYDQTSGVWQPVSTSTNLTSPVWGESLMLMQNGTALVAGGANLNGAISNAYVYSLNAQGSTCVSASDCASDICATNGVNSYCCSGACTGACSTCVTGSCGFLSPGTACGSGFVCSGNSYDCPQVPCGGDFNCIAADFCNAAGQCAPQQPPGAICNTGIGGDCKMQGCRECSNGSCTGGACPCTTTSQCAQPPNAQPATCTNMACIPGACNSGFTLCGQSTYGCLYADPPQDIVRWLQGENNTQERIFNLPTTFPVPNYGAGKVGNAFLFHGYSTPAPKEVVDVSPNGQEQFPAFTMSAWINPNGVSPTGWGAIFYVDATSGYNLFLKGTSPLTLQVSGGNNAFATNYPTVTSGAWTHVAYTYDQNATPKGALYINGVLADLAPLQWTV